MLWPPGLHHVACTRLHRDPCVLLSAWVRQETSCPVLTLSRYRHAQRRKRARPASTHCIDINKIESIDPTDLMNIGEVRHPGIIDDRTAVPCAPRSADIRGADIIGQQCARPVERQIDDAIIATLVQLLSPTCNLAIQHNDIFDAGTALINQCMKVIGNDLAQTAEHGGDRGKLPIDHEIHCHTGRFFPES